MRLDQWLFENKYFESREKSRREILAGRVREKASGRVLDKPGAKVPKGLEVEILEAARFVGRAGDKLEGFLTASGLNPEAMVCLDVGSSTGGFSDCLLQRGARKIYAVDVGTHQLHEKLRKDSRLQLFEQTDIRDFDLSQLDPEPDWILVDVSFISIRKILPKLIQAFPQALFILLFKPQFEVGRFSHGKHGIVSEEIRQKSLEEMLLFLNGLGLNSRMVLDSAVKGMKGNQETFIAAAADFPLGIFRTYDIRGNASKQLSDQVFEKIGFVLGKRLKEKFPNQDLKVGLGSDARESSPRLRQALLAGLCRHKIHVLDLGSTTTPMLYFAKYHYNLDAAFQITASHNPAEDNGMKMMIGGGALFGEEILSIGREAAEVQLSLLTEAPCFAESRAIDLRTSYLKYLHEQFRLKNKYKLVVDCGNGMGALISREVFTPYASELNILFGEVDCRFPNHEADPTVEANLQDLIAAVKDNGADVGFAFDGDADRLGVVTRSGRILWGDEILMLLSEKVLRSQPGAPIIGEVKCSDKLFRRVKELGGEPVMYRTGHSLIKKKMKELNAPIAGEMSGHLFFADRYFGFDDAIYAALRVLEVMDELSLDLDEWIAQFPEAFITPEMRVQCLESEKVEKVERVRKYFEKLKNAELNLIDGVRVSFEDGAWALVRASNTQAVLVVRAEAPNAKRLSEVKEILSLALGEKI